MTELMKRYENETGECATWTWHGREFLTDDYIAWLEDQLRWRPVSEKPENEGMYFARWHDDSQPVVLRYIKYVWFRYDYELGDYASVIEPKWWLPIPPAPEGE